MMKRQIKTKNDEESKKKEKEMEIQLLTSDQTEQVAKLWSTLHYSKE
jgi:hypothetical protein